MTDSGSVLTHIHGLLGDKEAGIVGEMLLADGQLSIADGRASLRVEIFPNQGRKTSASMVHAHVIATLNSDATTDANHDCEELSACIVGIDPVHESALFDVSRVWVDLVAGPVFSMLLGRAVFESQQQRCPDGSEMWVGPVGFRFAELPIESGIGQAPLFQDFATLASPRKTHLAKATLDGAAGPKWRFTLELNGHETTFADSDWPGLKEKTHGGIAIQFAAMDQSGQPEWSRQRQAVDEAIIDYVQMHGKEDLNDLDSRFIDSLDHSELAAAVTMFVPSACARILFADQIERWPNGFHTVRPGGSLGEPDRLLSQVAYARCLGLAHQLVADDCVEGLKNCALRSSELGAINEALSRGSQVNDLQLLPILIPAADACELDIQLAMGSLVKQFAKPTKPWWRFW